MLHLISILLHGNLINLELSESHHSYVFNNFPET